jgi:acyl carrier protein
LASSASRIRRRQLLPSKTYVAPRTPTERKLAEIWCAVLHLDRVGVADNYLDLGGDSIMAMIMFAMIAQEFAVPVPTATLVEALTIAKLARAIDSAGNAPAHTR